MLVVLIVIPAIVVAVAVVVLLDRVGVLPHVDSGPAVRSPGYGYGSGFLETVPQSALLVVGALMALWILGWLVFLVVGLSVLAA